MTKEQVAEKHGSWAVSYAKLDNRQITDEEWGKYSAALDAWKLRDYPDEMSRAMSRPNGPNYARANND